MEQPSTRKQFIFNEKIDSAGLFSLYEDDFSYMAQVFGISSESLGADLPALYAAYAASDIAGLRKAAHKIKPVFGFTGLPAHQAAVAEFENSCLSAADAEGIRAAYEKLLAVIDDGRRIISGEAERLNLFAG